jgi:DNA-binding LytR/AlgR family response regulator
MWFCLKKIEDKLPKDLFLKVHRSFIITKKIIDIEDNSVLIAKDVIPVSRANRPELMKRLNLYKLFVPTKLYFNYSKS